MFNVGPIKNNLTMHLVVKKLSINSRRQNYGDYKYVGEDGDDYEESNDQYYFEEYDED